jgi:hypothetical protein
VYAPDERSAEAAAIAEFNIREVVLPPFDRTPGYVA